MTPAQMRDEADWLFGEGLRKAPVMLRAAADELERLEGIVAKLNPNKFTDMIQWIEDTHTITGSYDEDARYNWPERWKALKDWAAEAAAKAKESTR